jgi:DNA/RNA endonuclease YhcR with UshA esterase domain
MYRKTLLLSCVTLLCSALAGAACISPNEAAKHIGETKCVSGKVVRIEQDNNGAHYLQFCQDSKRCSFAAVIFPEDLKHIGDVRQLQGKFIEVHGDVKEYDGGTEVIVSESRQLKGEAASIPPLLKNYDVEKKGHYSAGVFSHPKTYSTTKKRQPATLPVNIPDDPPE